MPRRQVSVLNGGVLSESAKHSPLAVVYFGYIAYSGSVNVAYTTKESHEVQAPE